MAAKVRRKLPQRTVDDTGVADTGFAEIPSASDHISQKITWGEPAKICEASFDKHCPHCGHGRQDGFDLGINNGVVFGGWCDCGFSF